MQKKDIWIADLTHTAQGISANTFPLGAGYVASYAKKVLGTGYNVELFKFQDKLHDSIKNNSPHILQ